MLKEDQIIIRKILREEIESEAENITSKLQSEMKMFRIEIQSDIRDLTDRIKNLEIVARNLQKDIKKQTSLVLSLDNFFAPRIKRLEEKANLPTLSQD